jgi:predicted DCC family thiol-disulfide oxidoreductase YuxK
VSGSATIEAHPVVLFDGVCNMCNGIVRFLLARDRARRLRFASIQSEAGRALLAGHGLDPMAADTFVFVEGGRASVRSDAALAVARHLPAPWRWGVVLRALPRPWRDAAYRYVARHRYGWFGRRDTCMVPTPDVRERFLA